MAALLLFRRLGHLEGQMQALDSLGFNAHHAGKHVKAVGHYLRARILCRDIGNSHFEASIAERFGHPYLALGRYQQAQATWRDALDLHIPIS
jgi:tetratricopeptide (TPR) repeat protein